jgi:aminoglycoside 6'-N-acetyltransferase I
MAMSRSAGRSRLGKVRSRAPGGSAARVSSSRTTVRAAVPADLDAIVTLSHQLWREESAENLEAHARAVLGGSPDSTMPLTLFVAERAGRVIGFVEVGLRSHADGCDARRAVGFIEGWFVAPGHRGQQVGRSLMAAAETWAASQGCTEIASDTWIDNEASERAHRALGFEVVDLCINFRKALRPAKHKR